MLSTQGGLTGGFAKWPDSYPGMVWIIVLENLNLITIPKDFEVSRAWNEMLVPFLEIGQDHVLSNVVLVPLQYMYIFMYVVYS